MNHFYLSIANFTIKLTFHKTEIESAGKKFQTGFYLYYRGFIIEQKPRRIDYEIEFVENNNISTTRFKKRISIAFYHESGKKKITTYFHISRIQSILIMRNIIGKLLKNSGLILHCSASNIKGSAHVFVGKSGDGKSTVVSQLSSLYPTLSDDIGIIRKVKGTYYFYQTPFLERHTLFTKDFKKYPIRKLYLLHKSPECKIVKIAGRDAIVKKVADQVWTETEAQKKEKMIFLFRLFGEFSNYYRLFFSLDAGDLLRIVTINA